MRKLGTAVQFHATGAGCLGDHPGVNESSATPLAHREEELVQKLICSVEYEVETGAELLKGRHNRLRFGRLLDDKDDFGDSGFLDVTDNLRRAVLGDDYPLLFPVGDTLALVTTLRTALTDETLRLAAVALCVPTAASLFRRRQCLPSSRT